MNEPPAEVILKFQIPNSNLGAWNLVFGICQAHQRLACSLRQTRTADLYIISVAL